MRQSDGSEILGLADPRKTHIGIIHVSPGDDRQSVITAITTQEKLGREQIVLDLPVQNKAFKNAIDFEGLHKMASEIEATLFMVIPPRSRIAALARRENFTIYPSMDELVEGEFPPDTSEDAPEDPFVPATPEETVFPTEDDEDHTMTFPIVLPPGVLPSTVSPSAQAETPDEDAFGADHMQLSDIPETPPPTEDPSPISAYPVEEDEFPAVIFPLGASQTSEDGSPGEAFAPVTSSVSADEQEEEEEEEPVPAVEAQDFSVAPATRDRPLNPEDEPTLILTRSPDRPTRSTALVPTRTSPPVFYNTPPAPPRSRSWRGLLLTLVVVLLLIALGFLFYRPLLDWAFPPSATIVITPQSQHLQHTYQITAVLDTPDASLDQVQARALYAHSLTRSQVVNATGTGHSAGQQARGNLVFSNTTTTTQTIPAGTVIVYNDDIAVFTDTTLTLPPSNPSHSTLSSVSGPAHTISAGLAQDLPANSFNNTPCCGTSTIFVSNPAAFSGGADLQNFSYVQQSDIDGAVQSVEASLAQQATKNLTDQIRPGEQIVSSPQCLPQVTSNFQAGDRAETVQVTVTAVCTGEVYDMQAVQTLATEKLIRDASANPGSNYTSVGPVLTGVTYVTIDGRNVLLTVVAQGIWTFQFTDGQRTHLARLIVGKNTQDARQALLGQPGVKGVSITLTGVGVNTMPGDPNHIAINVEAVSGLHG